MIVLSDPTIPSRVYTGTDTRAFSLLLGAVAATTWGRAVLARAPGRRAGAGQVLLLLAMAAAWVLVDGPDAPGLFSGGLFAYAVAAAVLIGWCVQESGSTVSRALAWPPLRWVGSVSYSLYLWHWPVIVLLTPRLSGFDGWARTLVMFVASIALAALSKYLLEDPVRYRATWARGTTGAIAFVVLMLALALLWVMLPAPTAPVVDITDLR
jgi:peptidoglycan/LPS O-acetylase OafA/YrhL